MGFLNRYKEKNDRPPLLAELLFRYFTPENLLNTAPGDLAEVYFHLKISEGKFKANIWYWKQIVKSLPLFIFDLFIWSINMFSNYLKFAFRNLKRNRSYSFLNILGLTAGITCFFLLILRVEFELSYDDFHENKGQIFRFIQKDEKDGFSGTPYPLGPSIKNDFPEIIDYIRMEDFSGIVSYKDNSYYENSFLVADPGIFEIFSFSLVRGDKKTVLEDPWSVVITERAAAKYFGSENPVGKTISFVSTYDFTITGIAKNPPVNSNIDFDFIARFEKINDFYGSDMSKNWGASNFFTYLYLQKGISTDELLTKLTLNSSKYSNRGIDFFRKLRLQPIEDIHITYYRGNQKPVFEKKYFLIFSAIAVIVLIIACINFINLCTAVSTKRAKEIGLRKVVGAKKIQLVRQLLTESVMYAMLSFFLSLIAVYSILPYFSSLTGGGLEFSNISSFFYFRIFIVVVLVGIISGIYPAFVISSFQPERILKSKIAAGNKGAIFRNVMVILQFAASIALIISSFTIFKQINYIYNKDLGWNSERMITIPIQDPAARNKTELIKREFMKNPDVISASASTFVPTRISQRHGAWWEGRQDDEKMSVWVFYVDHDFFKTMQIEFAQGREFLKEATSDYMGAYILNAAAYMRTGWTKLNGQLFNAHVSGTGRLPVIGVTKNFNFRSLHHSIEPCIFFLQPERTRHIMVRISGQNITETLSYLKTVWDGFNFKTGFEYSFMDETFDQVYESERKLSNTVGVFTFLAVFISGLGLFGLSAFVVEKRIKEIGVRKALGASTGNIYFLLIKGFLAPVVLANIFAWPAAYFYTKNWLGNFIYRVDMDILLFIAATLLSILVSLFTVGFKTVNAARANPVDSLRNE